jgi:hypothetical protein
MNTFIKEDSSYTTISRKLQTVLESFGFAFESTRHQKREGDKKVSFYTVSVGLSKFITEYLERGINIKPNEMCLINPDDDKPSEESIKTTIHDDMLKVVKDYYSEMRKTDKCLDTNLHEIETDRATTEIMFNEIYENGLLKE